MRDRLSTKATPFTHRCKDCDAQGRVATIADGSGTRTFGYTPAGLPISETLASGRALTWDYDSAGRKVGYALWENGAFQTWGGWGYRPADAKMNGVATREGWMASADAAAAGGGRTRTLTLGTFRTETQRDGMGRLRRSETFVNNVTPTRLAARRYDYDSAGRLVSVREGEASGAGGQASAFTERSRWLYGYNARGEVSAASAKWADGAAVAGEQFGTAGPGGVATVAGYTFDGIGNRTYSVVNGRGAMWTVNHLNQVTNRYGGSTNVLDVLGEADASPGTTVRVNTALVPAANRHGANFYAAVPVSSGYSYTEPRWVALTVQ